MNTTSKRDEDQIDTREPSTPRLEMSEFIAGFWRMHTWDMSTQQRLHLLETYLDLGITTMDHADIYGQSLCESLFGEALALRPSLREQMQIVSKCGIKPAFDSAPERYVNHYDTGQAHILASVDASLNRLTTDRLDLLLIHRPDPLMRADEVAATFEQLKQAGKVLNFGVSNFTPAQFDLLQSSLHRFDIPLVTNQVEISPMNMTSLSDGTLDHCQQHKIPPMAWSCLGGGNIFSSDDESSQRLRLQLAKIADEHGTQDISQIIYAWILALPSQPKPIIGSGQAHRIAAAQASRRIKLDKQQWFSIWQASMGHSVP